jgi:uncharacterized membrane protein
MLSEMEKAFFGKALEELNAAEKRVLKSARERRTVSIDAHSEFMADASFGQRLADSIARIGGSWGFIIAFFLFLLFWTSVNIVILRQNAFDPYPFIFLNLVLSMLAAIQAPVIMMSQNRQSERDRFMAAKDYEVNLKAEIEVLALHNKIDQQVLTEIREARADFAKLKEEFEAFSKAG